MDTGLKRPVAALLLVTSFTWHAPAAAFSFCFSKGGGSRNHSGYFPPPVAPGIGAGWYPALPYTAPAPRVVILPAAIREERLPADPVSFPEQHIFR
jgi:hypothetical protein